MGIVVGTIFRLMINRKKKLQFSLILASLGVALAVLTTLVIIFYNIDLISFSKSITKTTLYISIVVFFGYLLSYIQFFSYLFFYLTKYNFNTFLPRSQLFFDFLFILWYNLIIKDPRRINKCKI